MAVRDIVVVGASAGGIEAVVELVRHLPRDFPGSLFVVIHFPGTASSTLPHILSRAGPLLARHAQDGEPIQAGRIYVAPPDLHMLLEAGHIRFSRGPKENGSRPAIDPLFRTAARSYGPRVIGVILSGNLNDGTAGLITIKQRGGVAMVQTLESALYPGMPTSAMEHLAVDYALSPGEMAERLTELAQQPVDALEIRAMSDEVDPVDQQGEVRIEDHQTQPGIPSTMSCPECHGVLWEMKDQELVRFRCRLGHAYSAEALLIHQSENLEAALWTALRALEEHSALSRRLASRASSRGHARSASTFTEQAMDAEHHASVIRTVLHAGVPMSDTPDIATAAAG